MYAPSDKQSLPVRRLYAEGLVLGTVAAAIVLILHLPMWTFAFTGIFEVALLAIRLPQIDPQPVEPELTRRESLMGWLELCRCRVRRLAGGR
jgi:hypothetical protein